ncbi:MAG: response regulator, partial [Proteobacteria bacterium]
LHDITERKRTELELHRAKHEADAANLAKSEFLSRMSHELRTPLNAILGFSQILEKEQLTALQKESVGYVLKGGRHLLNLIDEVLDIARLEAGRVDLSIEPVALDDVIPEACAMIKHLAAEHHIQIEPDFSKLGRVYVLADHQRLKLVLVNLLTNAIKYNQTGGQIFITCTLVPNEQICISIRDTGPGIAPDDLAKLFTPFERLKAVNSEVEGTGLGLVLSLRLVTSMGGTLEVESVCGQGTTFTIKLPQTVSPECKVADLVAFKSDKSLTNPNTQTSSVLCIEDNSSNLRLLEIILTSRPSITMLTAMEGGIGLELARKHKPNLILLDLHLPDMSGQEVLTVLKGAALTKDIPVVVVSADATAAQIHQLNAAGATAYLTKPLNVTEFLRT